MSLAPRGIWVAAAVLCLWATAPGHAQQGSGLAAAHAAALANDPEYRAARFELEAREQQLPIARAGLLPSVSASLSSARVRGDRTVSGLAGQDATQQLDYSSPSMALQLRAPLFNAEAMGRQRSAAAQVESARAQFQQRGLDLLDRLATAFLQRLLAEEGVALAQAQLDAYASQSLLAQRRYTGGEGTRTDAADAAASLAIARVQLIEAQDQRDLAERALARITGPMPPTSSHLPDELFPESPPQTTLPDWLEKAQAANPSLMARRHQVQAAREEIERARAGHMPRLDLLASATEARNDSVNTLNQKSRLRSAGVQLTLPLYAGGGIDAGVRQATADLARAEAQLQSDGEQLAMDVRTQYQLAQSSRLKVVALGDALAASRLALEGAQRGLAAGLRTSTDVMDALRRMSQAQRDRARARLEALLARLRLQTLAGHTPTDVAAEFDRQMGGR